MFYFLKFFGAENNPALHFFKLNFVWKSKGSQYEIEKMFLIWDIEFDISIAECYVYSKLSSDSINVSFFYILKGGNHEIN